MDTAVPRPLSVLALMTEAYGGYGGIAQYNCDLLDALHRNVVVKDITVVARLPISAPGEPQPQLRIFNPKSRLGFVLEVLARAMAQRFDIIFCGHVNFVPVAALVAHLQKARLILQTHGIDVWKSPAALKRLAAERADLVLCVSRFTRERLLSWSGIAPEKVLVIANTYRDKFYVSDREIPDALKGKRVLLTVGRLDGRQRHKGHDRVIQCLTRIRRNHPDILYVIVGDGSDRERLQKLAVQCGVASMVHFAGRVSDSELPAYYQAAHLFVMPSTGDGFGIAFLEAMACGTPALGIDAGGVRDALADGDLGLLARDEDFDEALERAIALPAPSRVELSNRVQARFGRDFFQERIDSVIERLAA